MRNSKLVQFYYLGEKSFNKLSEIVKKRKIDEDSRVECLHRADWAGGYLYLR